MVQWMEEGKIMVNAQLIACIGTKNDGPQKAPQGAFFYWGLHKELTLGIEVDTIGHYT